MKENEDLERKKRYQQKECREMLLKAVQDKQKHLDAEKQIQLAEEKAVLENDLEDTDKEYEKIRNKKVRCFMVSLWGNASCRPVVWPCELHRVTENRHSPSP